MIDHTALPGPPEQAARDSYQVFTHLFPQRMASWDDLAEWERDRWRKITAAARAYQEPPANSSKTRCSAGLLVTRMAYGIAELPHAEHSDGTRCDHQIYLDGVLVYNGVLL
jgi:hypothetical protein